MRLTFVSSIVAALLAACGGDKPVAETVAPTPEVVQVDAAPPKPASRIDEAKAIFEGPLEVAGPKGIDAALKLADALTAEGTPEAKIAAARIRLIAVARDVVQVAAGGETKIPSGALAQAQLAIAAGKADGTDAGGLVARIGGGLAFIVSGASGDRPADPTQLRSLEKDPAPEAAAYREALAARYAQAREQGDAKGFEAYAASFGPLLCVGCDTTFPASCADASPCELAKKVEAVDPIAGLGANALTLAGLEVAATINAPAEPVVLPVPVALAAEATLGPSGPQAGLGESAPALIVANLGPTDLKIGVRAIVGKDGALPKLAAGVALREAAGLAYDKLAEAEVDKDTGGIPGVTDVLAAARASTAAQPEGWPSATLPGDKGAVLLAIAPEVTVDAVSKVADGILAGGPTALRVLRPGPTGEVLPLFVRALTPELEAALVPSWDKSMVVVVSKGALDVWSPEGPKEGAAAIGEDALASLPTTSQQGWRKDKLARLRVPRNVEATRPATAELQALGEAIKVFSDKAKAGRVIHVVAGDGATVADVLEVSRYLQEVGLEPAPELARVGEIWAGARCRGTAAEGDTAVRGDAGCAGAVAIAFSKRAAPSERGLSDKPGGKKEEPKEPKEPKPEPGPAPSAEFCNQADIKSQMAKKAGAFRFCYERELQLEKDLAGRVVMNFVIGLPGNVKSVRVASSDLKNAKVGECIKKEIGKITFKAPDGGECVVQWPFKFTSQ